MDEKNKKSSEELPESETHRASGSVEQKPSADKPDDEKLAPKDASAATSDSEPPANDGDNTVQADMADADVAGKDKADDANTADEIAPIAPQLTEAEISAAQEEEKVRQARHAEEDRIWDEDLANEDPAKDFDIADASDESKMTPPRDDTVERPRKGISPASLAFVGLAGLVGGAFVAPATAPYLPAPIANILIPAPQVTQDDLAALRAELSQQNAETQDNLQATRAALPDMIAQQLEEISSRTDKLGADLDALLTEDSSAASTVSRIAANETDLAGLTASFNDLQSEIAALAAQLDNLSTGAAKSAAQTAETPVTNSQPPRDLAKLEQTLRGQQRHLSNLDARTGDLARQIGALDGRLTAAEAASKTALEKAQADAEAAAKAAQTKSEAVIAAARTAEHTALMNAFIDRMNIALANGNSYSEVLADNSALLADSPLPQTVVSQANDGIASMETLTDNFPDQARAAIAADIMANAEDGFIAQSKARLQSGFVSLPTTAIEGSAPDAILGRAWAALRQNDLEAALTQIDSLTGAAKTAMAAWATNAHTRLEVTQNFATWQSSVSGQ